MVKLVLIFKILSKFESTIVYSTIIYWMMYACIFHFHHAFGKYKKKGRDFNSLLMAFVSYKLTENFSIIKASDWINRKEVLDTFDLKEFDSYCGLSEKLCKKVHLCKF